uniref:Uncharacterized protein n=1 Tax=Glossina austeni TaxID=7395 RepID=A0A1A9UGW4_GLOAU
MTTYAREQQLFLTDIFTLCHPQPTTLTRPTLKSSSHNHHHHRRRRRRRRRRSTSRQAGRQARMQAGSKQRATTFLIIIISQPGISQCHRVIVFPNKWRFIFSSVSDRPTKNSKVSNPPKSGNRRTSQPTMKPTEPVN